MFSFERVNKAGAKFDWAKLDWLNSQYLHKMPAAELTDLLIPYWQELNMSLTRWAIAPLEQLNLAPV